MNVTLNFIEKFLMLINIKSDRCKLIHSKEPMLGIKKRRRWKAFAE
jgi:hypothetical protein